MMISTAVQLCRQRFVYAKSLKVTGEDDYLHAGSISVHQQISWIIAARAGMSSRFSGETLTSPGTDIFGSKGVVAPTTPIFSPEGVVITALLLTLFGIAFAFLPGVDDERRQVAIKTEIQVCAQERECCADVAPTIIGLYQARRAS